MNIPITSELAELFGRIVREHHSEDEWAAIESDDMFQTLISLAALIPRKESSVSAITIKKAASFGFRFP